MLQPKEFSMATPTIFPGLIVDIEDRILSHMGHQPYSLVALSGTCTLANGKLSNGKYFEALFAAQHPLLAKTDQVFLQLRTYYPDCCWKAACCLMLKDYTPFKMEFLQRPVSVMAPSFIAQKEPILAKKLTAETKDKQICGSFYQDPDSPIHQAWDAVNRDMDEQDNFMSQNYEIIKELLVPFDRTIKYLAANQRIDSELLPDSTMTKIATLQLFDALVHPSGIFSKDITEIEQYPIAQTLDLNRIEEYRKVIPFLCEIKENQETLAQKTIESNSKYLNLERERKLGIKEALACSKKLEYIEKNLTEVWRANHLHLLVDQYFARNAEKFAGNALMLVRVAQMCAMLDLECSSNEEEIDPRNPYRFFDTINFHYEENNLIWEMLYHQCANGAQAEQWAEKHCHIFSKELVDILTRLKTLTTAFIPIYFENLDLKDYVEKNYDVIKKGQLTEQLSNLTMLEKLLGTRQQNSFSESDDMFGTMQRPSRIFEILSKPIVNLLFLADSIDELLPTVSSLITHIEQHEEKIKVTEGDSRMGLGL
jgi:hypothetical protein